MKQWMLCTVAAVCVTAGVDVAAKASVPWATNVVQYDYDGDGNPANNDATYSNPSSALGEPSRMGGVGSGWDGVVSMFNSAWTGDEVVSLAPGGRLVVGFDRPIVNDPGHLYGVDLIVFGNATFSDSAYPAGQIDAAGTIWAEPGRIEVSADGLDWREVPGAMADSLFPTQAWLDSGPYDAAAGQVPSDFQRPVNPALTAADFAGLTYSQALALYDGSGGGTPVDIGVTGLDMVQYVRITVPQAGRYSVEVDALAVVPEPMSLLLLVCAAGGALRRRTR